MFNLLYFSLFVYYYFLCVYWDSTALTNSSVVDSTSNALLINVFVILIPVFHRLLDVCTNSSCSSKWLVTMNSSAFVDISSECTEILKLFLLFYLHYCNVFSQYIFANTSETNQINKKSILPCRTFTCFGYFRILNYYMRLSDYSWKSWIFFHPVFSNIMQWFRRFCSVVGDFQHLFRTIRNSYNGLLAGPKKSQFS